MLLAKLDRDLEATRHVYRRVYAGNDSGVEGVQLEDAELVRRSASVAGRNG